MSATVEEVQVKPKFNIRRGQFYPCDAAFRENDIKYQSCGTRSYYFALINGVQLSFCGHHGTRFEAALLQASKGNVIDLRHTILDDTQA